MRDVAYTRVYTYVRDVHEGAVYTKTQFVRSVRSFRSFRRVYPRAYVHTDTRVHAHRITRDLCARVRARVSTCAPGTYVWVLTFHDLSRSFQRASKRPESAQIDKRNNRGREIEGLDLIRREKEREGEKEGKREARAR